MSQAWSLQEVEATVADYLQMWLFEQSEQAYSKTTHRNALLKLLNHRTPAAVELKHQNISAVLVEHGWPPILGYLPRGNYQKLLATVVAERMMVDQQFDQLALAAVESEAAAPFQIANIHKVWVKPPPMAVRGAEPVQPYFERQVPNLKRDYLDREARNRSLGLAGEQFVMAIEARRLHEAGKRTLADRIEHSSLVRGDGLGFDVQSFNEDGSERFIEVKTTASSKETPFYLSENERAFADAHSEQFHLYRLFDFRKQPKLFDLPGAVEKNCLISPSIWVGRFG